MDDQITSLLEIHSYFRGASDAALKATLAAAKVKHYDAGAILHEANTALSTVGFVLRGRLKAVQVDSQGRESLFRMIERGDQLGMMVGAMSTPVPVRVVALEPSIVLELAYEHAIDLTFEYRDLRLLWLRSFAESFRNKFFGVGKRRGPMLLAIIHEGTQTRDFARRLCKRLSDLDESLGILSDQDGWDALPRLQTRRLHATNLNLESVRSQVAAWQDADRVIFELQADAHVAAVHRLIGLADRVFYVVQSTAFAIAAERLRLMIGPDDSWRDKISVCWRVSDGQTVGPAMPSLRSYAARDFKVGDPNGHGLDRGLERVVHELRGVRIGVSLGGGAARGMAHLGVLQVLEENGIIVDAVAGTSAGAMTGILYASGLDCKYAAQRFAVELQLPWLFRQLPHGEHWHLLYQYRRGQFGPMLRKYLRTWHLEQLPVPCFSVALDLVSGSSIVRDRGDAVEAILESINLPVFATPICRAGQALVDGGLIKNIPADVLVSTGCNFVIAVSVTAKIESDFCGITPGAIVLPKQRPTVTQTLLRSLLVQNYNLNAVGAQPADLVVEPDVSRFDPADFTRVEELAAIGAKATRVQLPRIRHLLARLDPQMFGTPCFGSSGT